MCLFALKKRALSIIKQINSTERLTSSDIQSSLYDHKFSVFYRKDVLIIGLRSSYLRTFSRSLESSPRSCLVYSNIYFCIILLLSKFMLPK